MLGLIDWLVMRFCTSRAAGRTTSSTPTISSSWPPASAISVFGVWLETSETIRPMNTGIVTSRIATARPAANSAATSPGA